MMAKACMRSGAKKPIKKLTSFKSCFPHNETKSYHFKSFYYSKNEIFEFQVRRIH
jgi:hypothetical protein